MPMPYLPGDLLTHLLASANGEPLLPDRERVSPSLDPQSIAEFLAYDLPFETEPITAFTFPPEPTDA